jgi:hypothetical protein
MKMLSVVTLTAFQRRVALALYLTPFVLDTAASAKECLQLPDVNLGFGVSTLSSFPIKHSSGAVMRFAEKEQKTRNEIEHNMFSLGSSLQFLPGSQATSWRAHPEAVSKGQLWDQVNLIDTSWEIGEEGELKRCTYDDRGDVSRIGSITDGIGNSPQKPDPRVSSPYTCAWIKGAHGADQIILRADHDETRLSYPHICISGSPCFNVRARSNIVLSLNRHSGPR